MQPPGKDPGTLPHLEPILEEATTTISGVTSASKDYDPFVPATNIPRTPTKNVPKGQKPKKGASKHEQLLDPPLPVTAEEVNSLKTFSAVTLVLLTTIADAVKDGKSVTAMNKKRILAATEEIRQATEKLTGLSDLDLTSPLPLPMSPLIRSPSSLATPPPTASSPPSNDLKQDIIKCVREEMREEMSKFKAEFMAFPPRFSAAGAATAATAASNAPPSPAALTRPNYASVVAASVTKTNISKPKPAIIIKCTDSDTSNKNPSELLDAWKKQVPFRQFKYAPAKIQNVSNGKIRVEFDDPEHCRETIERTKSIPGFDAESAKRSLPLLIIKGIPKEVDKLDLPDILKSQNNFNHLRMCYYTNNRNVRRFNAVIEVDPETRKTIIEFGKVNIDHQRIHVEDHSRFTQCFKCLQFGHIKAKCTSPTNPCAYCAQEGHSISDCPHKEVETKRMCLNCHNYNNRTGSKLDTRHNATNNKLCSRIINMREHINQRTDYGV